MARRIIAVIKSAQYWDGAARPVSEGEAIALADNVARDIGDAGFSIALVVDQDLRRLLEEDRFPTIH